MGKMLVSHMNRRKPSMETVSGTVAAAAVGVTVDGTGGFAEDGLRDTFPDSGDGGDADDETMGSVLGDSLPRDGIDARAEWPVPLFRVVGPAKMLSRFCPWLLILWSLLTLPKESP